jgi:hypothetical protein
LDSIMIQIKAVHIFTLYFRSIVMLSSHLCLGLQSTHNTFPSGFPFKIFYKVLIMLTDKMILS